MAKTATFLLFEIANLPKFSIKVDFPAPGTPVIPTLIEFPVNGSIFLKVLPPDCDVQVLCFQLK
ncbi:hypothetical protein [Chryseobacterium balustinum]|uniref:hypothetical protein n=1 Tax=Chryseobacterium balustinum TaxID=246 RepID=UPI0030842367